MDTYTDEEISRVMRRLSQLAHNSMTPEQRKARSVKANRVWKQKAKERRIAKREERIKERLRNG